MSKKTVIYLQFPELTTASYALINEQHEIEQSAVSLPLPDISIRSANTEVIVIIPAEDILLLSAFLPKLSAHRLKQALPFALEEHIIDDLTTLHFAVGPFQPDHTWPVAVIAKKTLENWLTILSEANIFPAMITPETFALPTATAAWFIALNNHHAIVRTGPYSGFSSEASNLATLLSLKLNEELQKPNDIYLHDSDQDASAVLHSIDNIPIQVQEMSKEQLVQDFAKRITQQPILNLLQGSYQAKKQISTVRKTWLTAAMIAIATVLLALAGHLISFFILQQQSTTVNTAIRHLYQKIFPTATAVTAPQESLQKKLKEVQTSANRNLFLTWLAYVGQALAATPDIHIKNLDFRNQQMTLELSAATFDSLDNVITTLQQFGLNAKQQNAVTDGEQVKANVLIQK